MDQGALVTDQVEAGNRFLREFERCNTVLAAFWLKEADTGHWRLFIVLNGADNGKVKSAYGEVVGITNAMNDPYLGPFQVTLVRSSEPTARAVLQQYKRHPAQLPVRIRDIQAIGGEEAYILKGPAGEFAMPSEREVLHKIIDQEAAFFQQHGKPPRKVKLPVLMAYDLAKCGREDLGELSGRVFKDGITAFEKEGFHGMAVEIIRDRDAVLEFE